MPKKSFLHHLIALPSSYFHVLADSALQNVLISPVGANKAVCIRNHLETIQLCLSICAHLYFLCRQTADKPDLTVQYFLSSETLLSDGSVTIVAQT